MGLVIKENQFSGITVWWAVRGANLNTPRSEGHRPKATPMVFAREMGWVGALRSAVWGLRQEVSRCSSEQATECELMIRILNSC